MYQWLKSLHILLVFSTYTLFFVRGIWSFRQSPRLQHRWTRTVPHLIDTLLLLSAITLALTIHQYPFINAWLTAKVLGLLLYIGLGFVALRQGTNHVLRFFSWLGAQSVFVYIVLVAVTHNPIP